MGLQMSVWEQLIDGIQREHEPIFRSGETGGEQPSPASELFCERARGFRKAADLVFDAIAADENLFTAEMLPAGLFLYRQAIELHLKSMRCMLAERVSLKFKFARNHELLVLWLPIEEFLRAGGLKFENGSLHYRVGCIVREFSSVDRVGDRFRFPDSLDPAAAYGLWTKYSSLKLGVAEVDLLNFGFSELISFLQNSE
jgi:hypothetical protein